MWNKETESQVPGSPGRVQKVDVGVTDVCCYGGSVISHIVKVTKLHILSLFSPLHINYTAQLSLNKNWLHIKIQISFLEK